MGLPPGCLRAAVQRKARSLLNAPALTSKLRRLVHRRRQAQSVDGPGQASARFDEQPLRSELYSVDQLERHARAVAESHVLSTAAAADKLLPRLDDNER